MNNYSHENRGKQKNKSGTPQLFDLRLEDINLSTKWPSDVVKVAAEQPKGRPKAIGEVGELDSCLDTSILELDLAVGTNTRGSELAVTVAVKRFPDLDLGTSTLHFYIVGTACVVLDLSITPAPVAIANIVGPTRAVECAVDVELFAPLEAAKCQWLRLLRRYRRRDSQEDERREKERGGSHHGTVSSVVLV